MITNLLDASVKGIINDNEIVGKIRGIYEDGEIFAIVVGEDGTLFSRVNLTLLKVVAERIYAVVVFWTPEKKIMTIKIIREHTGMSLKEAKEYVEAHYGQVVVKAQLTKEEAEEIARRIKMDKMECEVRREF